MKDIPFVYSDSERHQIQQRLNKALGPEYISKRPSGGSQKVLYIEGWKAINLANEIFGYNGWTSQIVASNVDFCDVHNGRFTVGVSMIVRVSIKDGTFHEDVGYGFIENAKSKPQAFEKCRKEALTDGIKRCLRCFGNVLGNCLYDKSITNQLKKLENTAQVEYTVDDFHRDPLLIERERKKVHQEQMEHERKLLLQQEKLQKARELAKKHEEREKLKQEQSTFVTPKSPVKVINTAKREEEEKSDDDDSFLFSDDINEDMLEKQLPPPPQLQPQQQPPSMDFGFVAAKNANLLQANQTDDLQSFDTSFVAPSFKRTVDPTKSVPIKRTESKPNALKPNHLQNRMNQPSTNPLNHGDKIISYSQIQQDQIKRPIEEDMTNDVKRPCNE